MRIRFVNMRVYEMLIAPITKIAAILNSKIGRTAIRIFFSISVAFLHTPTIPKQVPSSKKIGS